MKIEIIDGSRLSHRRRWRHSPVMAMPALNRPAAIQCAQLMAARSASASDGIILIVIDDHREGFISVINRVFAQCEGDYFGYVAEDAFPGRGWLFAAEYAMRIRDSSLLAFNDGKWHGRMAAFGLARCEWVRGLYNGNFFYPGYRQHFADYELSRIAQHQGLFVYEPSSILIELDWNKDRRSPDPADKALFNQRETEGFGGLIVS